MKTVKKLVIISLIVSTAAVLLSVGASAGAPVAWGAANSAGDGVRIRSGPDLNSDVLNHANREEPIIILERTNNEWYRVNYNGTIGYASVPLLERPRTAANFSANGRVTGSDVNMREGPGTASNVIASYDQGTVMNIIGINEGWYKVRHSDKTGYIRSDLIELVSSNGASSSGIPSSPTGKLTGSNINMRDRASTSGNILGTYALGTVMDVIGVDGNWYQVQYDGKTGYIRYDFIVVTGNPPAVSGSGDSAPAANSSYVEPSAPAPNHNSGTSAKIVDLAHSLLGSRYVYGGASPSGFDCSGFVYYIYRQVGINLTRNASGQYRDNGSHINKSELAPGDLIFTSSNGRTVTHVGIYIGNNQMIHASTPSTGVIISTLDSGNSSRTIFGAKRVA